MRIEKLDGLRGVFSIMVVLFHFNSEFIPDFLFNNFIIRKSGLFVDFFFVLSGFVIALNYTNLSKVNEFTTYLKKRLIRIYPLLFWTAMVFFAVYYVCTYYGFTSSYDEIEGRWLINLAETLLLTNSTPILGVNYGINYPSWTISSEMISYIVFGLLSLTFTTVKKPLKFAIVIGICVTFLWYLKQYWVIEDYGFVRGLYAFLMGCLVYKFYNKKRVYHKGLEFITVLVLLVYMYLLSILPLQKQEVFSIATIPLLFASILFILLHTNGMISNILESRTFQFLGKISYSVYLNHAIIIVLLPNGIQYVFDLSLNPWSQTLILIVTMLALIIYSNFTYVLVEKRVGNMLKRKLLKTSNSKLN